MILVLLSTYNGSTYLHDFLTSLQSQTMTEWLLLVRDDMSNDSSLLLVKKFFKTSSEKLIILKSSNNVGVKESFHLLIKEAMHLDKYSYFMFADQDDVWKKDKIAITFERMKKLEKENTNYQAILVHTDLHVVDEKLRTIDNSLWHYEGANPKKNSLNYLLYRNTVTGCTMMVNKELVKIASSIPKGAIMHDWWFAIIASTFGKIEIINEKTLYYRQHTTNTIGAKKYSLFKIFKKVLLLFTIQNKTYHLKLENHRIQAKEFLNQYHDKLSEEEIILLECFINLPNMSFLQKRINIYKHKCFKQNFIQTMSLLLQI